MKRQAYHPSSSATARSRVPRPPLPFNLPSLSKEAGASQALGGIAATGAKWASNRPAGPDLPRHPDSRDESSPAPKAAWGGAGLRQSRPSSEFPHLSKPASPTPVPQRTPDPNADAPPDKSRNSELNSSSNPAFSADPAQHVRNFHTASGPGALSRTTEISEDPPDHMTVLKELNTAPPKEEDVGLTIAKIEFPIGDDDDDEDWADGSQQMEFLPLPIPVIDTSPPSSPLPNTSTEVSNVPGPSEAKPTHACSAMMFPPSAVSSESTNSNIASVSSTSHLPHFSSPGISRPASIQHSAPTNPTDLIRPSPMFPDRRGLPAPTARPSSSEGVDLRLIEEQKAIMKSKAELAHEARKRAEEERQRDLRERSARKLRELEERLRRKEQDAAAFLEMPIQETKSPHPVSGASSTSPVNGPASIVPSGKAVDVPVSTSSITSSSPALPPHVPPRHALHNSGPRASPRYPPDIQSHRDNHSLGPSGRRPRPPAPHRHPSNDSRTVRNVSRDNSHIHAHQRARHHHDYDGPADNETREQWLKRRRKETETRYAVRSIIDLLITRAVNGGHAAPKHLQHRRGPTGSAYPLRRDHLLRGSQINARRTPGHDTLPHDKQRPLPVRREMGSARHSNPPTSVQSSQSIPTSRPSTTSVTPAPVLTAVSESSVLFPINPQHSSEPRREVVAPERLLRPQEYQKSNNSSDGIALLSSTSEPSKSNQPDTNVHGSPNGYENENVEPVQKQTETNSLLNTGTNKSGGNTESRHAEMISVQSNRKEVSTQADAGPPKWVATPPVRLAPWASKTNERQPQPMRMSPMAEQRAQEAAEAAQRGKDARIETPTVTPLPQGQSSDHLVEDDPIVALPKPPAYLTSSQLPGSTSVSVHSVLPGSSQAVAQAISAKEDRNAIRKSRAAHPQANGANQGSYESPSRSDNRAVELPRQLEGNVKVLVNPKTRQGSVTELPKRSGRGYSISRSRPAGPSASDGRRGRGALRSRRSTGKFDMGRRERKERPVRKEGSISADHDAQEGEGIVDRGNSLNTGFSASKPIRNDDEESKAWANAQNGPTPLASFDEIKRAFSNQPVPFPLSVPAMIPAVPMVTEFKSASDADLVDTYGEDVGAWNDTGSWSTSKKDFSQVQAKMLKYMDKPSSSNSGVESQNVSKNSRSGPRTEGGNSQNSSRRHNHRHTDSRDSQSSDPNSSFERGRRPSRSSRSDWRNSMRLSNYESNSVDDYQKLINDHNSSWKGPAQQSHGRESETGMFSRNDGVLDESGLAKESQKSGGSDKNVDDSLEDLELKDILDTSSAATSADRIGHVPRKFSKPAGSRGRARRFGPGRSAHRNFGRTSNYQRGAGNLQRMEAHANHVFESNESPGDRAPQLTDMTQSSQGRAGPESTINSRRDRGKRSRDNVGSGRKSVHRGRPGFEKGAGRGDGVRRGAAVDGSGALGAGMTADNGTAPRSTGSSLAIGEEDSVEISKEDDDGRINVVLNPGRGRDGRGGRRRGFGSRVRGRGSRGRARGGGSRGHVYEPQSTGAVPTASLSEQS